MPCPKKKTTRSKRGMRRSHDALLRPVVHNCANCGSMMRPHRICLSCGYYKGTEVVAAHA